MLRISRSGRILVLLLLIFIPFILAAGCGGEKILRTNIAVYKLDPAGNFMWNATFDHGMQETGSGILEVSDGGYLIYGSESDNPKGDPGHRSYPLLIRLNSQGNIQWSRTLNQTFSPPTDYGWAAGSATESRGGNIIISTSRESNNLIQIDTNGTLQWIRPVPISIRSSIRTQDGGFLFVGNGVIKTDSNGTIQWEKPIESSKNVLQTSDGRYILDHVVTDWNRSLSMTAISCLDSDNVTIWTYEIGQTYSNDTTSLRETQSGLVEVTLASMRQLTFNRNGVVVAEKNITATNPMTRTSDGGYIYGLCSARETLGTFPTERIPCWKSNAVYHIIRETSNGTPVWDLPSDSVSYIQQTRDGGFVLLK